MKIFSYYDKENLIDRAWYSSSNVVYSECYDKIDDFKEVKIIFNNGRCYLYKNVDVYDYVMFKKDNSQGKALSKFITKKDKDGKPFYECIRLEDVNVDEIKLSMNKYCDTLKITLLSPTSLHLSIKGNDLYDGELSELNCSTFLKILDNLNVTYNLQ